MAPTTAGRAAAGGGCSGASTALRIEAWLSSVCQASKIALLSSQYGRHSSSVLL